MVYVLSDDIWRKRALPGAAQADSVLGPEEEASINLPPAIHVRTFKSTDEGVAFMVECGGNGFTTQAISTTGCGRASRRRTIFA